MISHNTLLSIVLILILLTKPNIQAGGIVKTLSLYGVDEANTLVDSSMAIPLTKKSFSLSSLLKSLSSTHHALPLKGIRHSFLERHFVPALNEIAQQPNKILHARRLLKKTCNMVSTQGCQLLIDYLLVSNYLGIVPIEKAAIHLYATQAKKIAQNLTTNVLESIPDVLKIAIVKKRAHLIPYKKIDLIYAINNAQLSPNGKHLVLAMDNGTMPIFDVAKKKLLTIIGKNNNERITSITFSLDGKKIFAASGNKVQVWNIAHHNLETSFIAHDSSITKIAISPNGNHLLTGSEDNTIKLWSSQSFRLINTIPFHSMPNSLAMSSNGNLIIFALANGETVAHDKKKQRSYSLKGHHFSVNDVSLNLDASKAVTVSDDKTAIIWNLDTSMIDHTLKGHQEPVVRTSFNNQGTKIITGAEDGSIMLWNTFTGNLIAKLAGHTKSVTGALFNKNGKFAITTSEDSILKIWLIEINENQALKRWQTVFMP